MNEKQIIECYPDIFNNLKDYAVVRNDSSSFLIYTIYNKLNNGFVLIEESSDKVAELMIAKGADLFNNINEAVNKNYQPYSLQWNNEKNDWVKIYHRDS